MIYKVTEELFPTVVSSWFSVRVAWTEFYNSREKFLIPGPY